MSIFGQTMKNRGSKIGNLYKQKLPGKMHHLLKINLKNFKNRNKITKVHHEIIDCFYFHKTF